MITGIAKSDQYTKYSTAHFFAGFGSDKSDGTNRGNKGKSEHQHETIKTYIHVQKSWAITQKLPNKIGLGRGPLSTQGEP